MDGIEDCLVLLLNDRFYKRFLLRCCPSQTACEVNLQSHQADLFCAAMHAPHAAMSRVQSATAWLSARTAVD